MNAEPAWLTERRASAIGRARSRGLPTNKDEVWRFTPLGLLPQAEAWFQSATSRVPALVSAVPGEATVTHISDALRSHASLLERHLGRLRGAEHAFAWLNTGLFDDGLFVHVHSPSERAPVIEVRDVADGSSGASHARTLVVVEPGCSLTLIERHELAEGSPVNAMLELVLGEDAVVEHLRVQSGRLHVGTVDVEQARGSRYGSRAFALGAAFSRLDLTVTLLGEGAVCELDGFFALRGREHADLCTVVDHRSPRCTSLERYKGVLADQARGVFDGTILVQRGAVGTNARQESRNLLLSDQAIVNTKPHLVIDADDVKCGHGATVGHLDPAQLFYLSSRGIDLETARAMLAFGFAQDILTRVRVSPEQKRGLRDAIALRIPGGTRLEEAS
jgi:Fe-S cluster assembly protein SufD